MDIERLKDLPEWDMVFPPFIEADEKGEERPTSETCDIAQELYAKWAEITDMIRGTFEVEDEDFDMVIFEGEVNEMIGENLEDTAVNREKYLTILKVEIVTKAYRLGRDIVEAECRNTYNDRMEKAFLIRNMAVSIDFILEIMEEREIDIDQSYIAMIRNEIELFRYLFRKWISSFKINVDKLDEWGLFV